MDGTLKADVSAFEGEVLGDPELAEEMYAADALQAELKAAAAARPARLIRMPVAQRWAWSAGLLAAGLAFFLIFPRAQDRLDDGPPLLRSDGTVPAVGVEPAGTWTHFPTTFRWRPAPDAGAVSYRWELFDDQARRRGFSVVSDTLLVRLSTETPADSVGVWRWIVVKLTPDGREGPTSQALEFVVEPTGRQ